MVWQPGGYKRPAFESEERRRFVLFNVVRFLASGRDIVLDEPHVDFNKQFVGFVFLEPPKNNNESEMVFEAVSQTIGWRGYK